MKAYEELELWPLYSILILIITWRWVAIFSPRQLYLQKNTLRYTLNRRVGGHRASLDILEYNSFLPHRLSHRVCPLLQLISLPLQRFCYVGLGIRSSTEIFMTQSQSFIIHLCSCLINFQRRVKKWQRQPKLKNSLGNKFDILKVTFSGIDFPHICTFIRSFFGHCNRTYSNSLKNDFVGYCVY
jgi:hypothetical protein